jgi:hypothetical protein
LAFEAGLKAQTFNSGSTGADGALTYSTPGIYTFDPKTFSPPLNPAADNIFNFTAITIGSGVTLKLTSKTLTGPIFWLASGDVNINGVIDLNGEDGTAGIPTTQSSARVPAAAGAGGFGGGLGGMMGASAPQNGNGPGGGTAATATLRGGDGNFTGNQFLVPLFGGSGGGGGLASSGTFGPGGGAGGGALLIASSTKINFGGGQIQAQGGNNGSGAGCQSGNATNPNCGGTGSGGAVRLVAPALTVTSCCTTFVDARADRGLAGLTNAADGKIRLEGFTINSNLIADSLPVPTTSTPVSLILPATPPPSIKVTSINGVPINANPFSFPDTSINSSSGVTINIEAHYVPVGTIPKVIVFSEVGNDQIVTATALSGTLALSTATATITFPTGGSRGYVKANW